MFIAIERTIAVYFPLKSLHWITAAKAKKVSENFAHMKYCNRPQLPPDSAYPGYLKSGISDSSYPGYAEPNQNLRLSLPGVSWACNFSWAQLTRGNLSQGVTWSWYNTLKYSKIVRNIPIEPRRMLTVRSLKISNHEPGQYLNREPSETLW